MFKQFSFRLKQHWAVILLTTTFFLLAATYSIVAPLFEVLDEVWHYPFVWHLARTGELPVQDPTNVQLWRQEGSQPPLYYALAALVTAPISTDDLPHLIYRNPHADLGLITTDGNINMIVHTAQEAWPWHGAALAVHIARLLSVVMSTGTVLTIYALGRVLWPERPLFAWLAMSFVAFNPMFLFVSGSVNNDNLVTLLASLALWQLAVLIVREKEPSLWQFVILGILVGLASLAKLSGLGLLGLVGLTLLWQGWRRHSWRTVILGNGIVGLLAIAIAGWWYWRNIALYGEWSGTQNMVAMMGSRSVTPTLEQLLAEVPGLMRSFWGLFGGLSLPMPSSIYWFLNLLLIVGLVGLPIAIFTGRTKMLSPQLRQVWPILVVWLILMLVGLVQWTLRTPASQGRLLFPGLVALAPLWVAGWMGLVPSRLYTLPALVLFILAIWVPWGVIAPAYALPIPVTTLPPTAQPLQVTFGGRIQLLAFDSQTPTRVRPGDTLPLTLFWRGEHPTETDYSIFIHLVDENDLIVAQRDIFHGLGLYPTSQWAIGAQFSDTYTLHIPRTAYAPAKAHFVVGLYDNTTGVRLSASTGGDTVRFGAVTIQPQAGDIPNPQDLLFEDGIALIGYTLDQRLVAKGESVKLTLYWQSRNQPSNNYKVFVHLVTDGDIRAAQHDSEPQNGASPTSTWMPGQVVLDEHSLEIASDVPPGAYRLLIGLYDGDTGQRLRLLRDSSVSVQADSVTLSGIRVVAR